MNTQVSRTDGKRMVCISNVKDHPGQVNVSVSNNGLQITEITIDMEMLSWLENAIYSFCEMVDFD